MNAYRLRRGVRVTDGLRAFTLIELLVVMSIISLLVSLLLPALSGARRTGQRVACMATLRNISQGASAYATDNDDAILGGPGTSGCALLRNDSSGNPQLRPAATGHLVQRWDFMGPLAQQWGLAIPEADGTLNSVITRFNATRNDNAFSCKGNGFLATAYSGSSINAKTGRLVSYNTVRWQLFILAKSAADARMPAGDNNGSSWYNNGYSDTQLPSNWRPSVTRLGVAANKVFCSDGARYCGGILSPDYDLSPNAGWGGAFSDAGGHLVAGPDGSFPAHSLDRNGAPGNQSCPPGSLDGRHFAFRHSTGAPPDGAAANAFKLNVVFHDGHAETQGDLTASNPHQWLPKDTTVADIGKHWKDTVAQFGLSAPYNIGP